MKRPLAILAVLSLMLTLPLVSQASSPGSWDVSGTYGIKVTWDQDPAPGTQYPETLILTQTGSGTITGTHLGAPCSPSCADFTITSGSVVGDAITIEATSPFTLDLTGTIALDGSMSGTWADGAGGSGRTGTWETTSGAAVFVPIDDQGPITSAVVVSPPKSGSGTMETVTANVDDTTTGGSKIKSAEFSVGGGAWTPMAAVDGTFDEVAENVSATFTAPLDGGTYDVCVRGTDVLDNLGDAVCKSLTVFDAYAEVSGTAGGPSGNGKSLAFSFDGWVATAGDSILGKVEVNYRILRQTCTYTPDANSGLTILSGVATLTNWHSSCAAGEYNLTLWDRDLYPQRGKVSVDGPGTTYDIALQDLATGNVHVRDLTAGTVHGFFSAADSRYYNGPTNAAPLYGTGPIEFTWANGVVTGGFWDEIVPPFTGTTYYNIADGTAVAWPSVTLHFSRTNPSVYAFTGSGSFAGTTFTGQMDGAYLFIATGVLIVS